MTWAKFYTTGTEFENPFLVRTYLHPHSVRCHARFWRFWRRSDRLKSQRDRRHGLCTVEDINPGYHGLET